jgi:hypothetical protein
MAENRPEVKSDLLPIISPFPTRSEALVLRAEGFYRLGGDDALDSEERRDALAHLMFVRPDLSNVELGRYFKVTERTIRVDKEIIRKRMSEEVTDKDISVVVADLCRHHEYVMTELAKSTKACKAGTPSCLAHLKFQHEAAFKIIEALQSLGVYPKNLGNITKTEFVYKAHVAKGGGVSVSTIQNDAELKTIEAEEIKQLPGAFETDEDRSIRASLEAEYSDSRPSKELEPQTPVSAPAYPNRVQRA